MTAFLLQLMINVVYLPLQQAESQQKLKHTPNLCTVYLLWVSKDDACMPQFAPKFYLAKKIKGKTRYFLNKQASNTAMTAS